jgi:hypothetical protein
LQEEGERTQEILSSGRLDSWDDKIKPLVEESRAPEEQRPFEALVQELGGWAEKLKEAARSVTEQMDTFNRLTDDIQGKVGLLSKYQTAVGVLSSYLDKLSFSDEDIEALTQRFLDFVHRGKQHFGFRFDVKLTEDNRLLLSREDLDGPIQPGGGETQIIGLLEMLAVATEFGFPIMIDEIESYLSSENVRKALAYVFQETDVQIVLTSLDQSLPDRLREWGIDHRAYMVCKGADGYTRAARL